MPYFEMILQPCKIVIRASRVDHKQKGLAGDSINNQVINDSAVFIQQERVLPCARCEVLDVVGEHPIEPLAPRSAVHDELSHMRNIKDTDMVSHCLMFLYNAAVLHRHEPPCERDDFGAKPHVLVVKRRSFFAHAPN